MRVPKTRTSESSWCRPWSKIRPSTWRKRPGRAPKLARALLTPHSDLVEVLGAHRVKGVSSLEVREGAGENDEVMVVESLTNETSILVDDAGNFEAILENIQRLRSPRLSSSTASFCYSRDTARFIVERRPAKQSPTRFARKFTAPPVRISSSSSPRAKLEDGGSRTIAGRQGRVMTITTAETSAEPRPRLRSLSTLAKGCNRQKVTGEFILDQESAATAVGQSRGHHPLRARRSKLCHGCDRPKRNLRHRGTTTRVEGPPSDQIVDVPLRHSELAERNELLKGIAPCPPNKVRPPPAAKDRAPK